MTREETINKWIIPAIKNTWNEKKCNEILKALEQEPCEDAISRQAAIVALDNRMQSLENVDMQIAMGFAKGIIHELPPVTAQPKMGRWVKTIGENGVTSAIRCSECGFEDNRYELFDYCPMCGCKMQEVKDDKRRTY